MLSSCLHSSMSLILTCQCSDTLFQFHCIFQGLKQNGNGKCYSKFTSKEYESIFHSMLALLDDIMKDPYHGPKLVQQLREWAKVGW